MKTSNICTVELAVYLCLTLVLGTPVTSETNPRGTKLLIFNIDGFKWNYFDRFGPGELPGFEAFMANGVKADYLTSQFPSNSFINYYSLMTGLYPESHGMLDNYLWDPIRKTEFLLGNNQDQYEPYWWDDGDPLWVTATRQGRAVYMWYWNGCEVEIRGVRPAFCSPYHDTPYPNVQDFKDAIDQALQCFKNGSADVAGIYLEDIDDSGHKAGPDSEIVDGYIKQLDGVLVDLLLELKSIAAIGKDGEEVPLEEAVNVVMFSDHGMASLAHGLNDSVIRIADYIDTDNLEVLNNPRQIWPKEGFEDEIYNQLKDQHPHMTVTRKADIPDHLHWKNHYRAPPILVDPDIGWTLLMKSADVSTSLGMHGYVPWNPDMRGIFLATGPDFKKGYVKLAFDNVQVYQLMCHLSDVTPSPHNGTWQYIDDMLLPAPGVSPSTKATASSMALFLSFVVAMALCRNILM